MSKTKKSKLLASMLCATVVAGLYAGPVMAEKLYVDSNNSVVTTDVDTTEITNLELSGKLTVGDNVLNSDTLGKVNNLFNSRATSAPVIYAGDGSKIGGVTFKAGSVTGVNNLTATGTITGNAITAKGRLAAYGGSSITAENTTKDKKVSSSVGATAVTDTLYTKVNDQYKVGASSSVGTTSIRDTVNKYDENGNRIGTGSSSVSATGISNSVTKYATDGKTVIGSASSAISGSGVTNTVTGNNDKKASSSVGLGTVTNTTYTYDANSGKYVEAAKTYMSTTGITDTFKDGNNLITSKVDKNGVTNSYKDENGVTHSMVTNGSGTKFTGNTVAGSTDFGSYNYSKIDGATATFGGSTNAKYGGQTVIKGGEITTDKVKTDELEIGNLAITEGANGGVSFGGTEFTVNEFGQIEVADLNIENVQLDASGLKLGVAGNEVFTVDTATGNITTTGTINGVTIGVVPNDASTFSAADQAGDVKLNDINVSAIDRNVASISRDDDAMKTTIQETQLTSGGRFTATSEVGYNQVTNKVALHNGDKHNIVSSTVNAYQIIDSTSFTNKNGNWSSAVTTKVEHSDDGISSTFTSKVGNKDQEKEIEASSKLTATGIVDSFTSDGVTNTVTTDVNGTTFSDGSTSTTIKGDSITTGTVNAANGLVVDTEGQGTFKVKNIDGNTMAYMVDNDGNYTVGINAQNGNIETKGALAVTNAEGKNVFTANSEGISVGGGLFAVDAATGNANIAGGLNVGTDIKVAGSITASSLTLDGMNVGQAINDLQDAVGDITGSGLPGKVEGIKRTGSDVSGYTTTIEGVVSVSEAKNGRPGTFSIVNGVDPFNDDVFSVNDHGFINATAIDYKGDVKAEFNLNDTEAKLVYGENGIAANANGTTITGAGTDLTLDANGATFTNVNGTTTIINGSSITTGAITADSISVGKIGDVETAINDLKDYVGDTGTGSETLAERVQGLETNTQNIIYQDSVTHIKGAVSFQNGYQVTFKHDGKDVSLGSLVDRIDDIDSRLDVVEDKTQNINSDATHGGNGETGEGGAVVDNGANTGFDGDLTVGGDITANNGNFVGDVQVGGSLNVGGENGTSITGEGMTVGSTNVSDGKITVGEGVVKGEDGKYTGSQVTVGDGDVKVEWTEDGEKQSASIQGNAQKIEDLGNTVTSEVSRLDSRIDKVEDRIDKVGAMSAAIANLRTMGYDPTAPTEIAVGIGQYRSETGAALGLFHYPNRDFMLSLSVSTSGDEVMGGIGATWKFGRKTPEQMLAAEKEKAAKAKLAKAEAMKKAAAEAKVAAQQAKHAKMAAEKAAK